MIFYVIIKKLINALVASSTVFAPLRCTIYSWPALISCSESCYVKDMNSQFRVWSIEVAIDGYGLSITSQNHVFGALALSSHSLDAPLSVSLPV